MVSIDFIWSPIGLQLYFYGFLLGIRSDFNGFKWNFHLPLASGSPGRMGPGLLTKRGGGGGVGGRGASRGAVD